MNTFKDDFLTNNSVRQKANLIILDFLLGKILRTLSFIFVVVLTEVFIMRHFGFNYSISATLTFTGILAWYLYSKKSKRYNFTPKALEELEIYDQNNVNESNKNRILLVITQWKNYPIAIFFLLLGNLTFFTLTRTHYFASVAITLFVAIDYFILEKDSYIFSAALFPKESIKRIGPLEQIIVFTKYLRTIPIIDAVIVATLYFLAVYIGYDIKTALKPDNLNKELLSLFPILNNEGFRISMIAALFFGVRTYVTNKTKGESLNIYKQIEFHELDIKTRKVFSQGNKSSKHPCSFKINWRFQSPLDNTPAIYLDNLKLKEGWKIELNVQEVSKNGAILEMLFLQTGRTAQNKDIILEESETANIVDTLSLCANADYIYHYKISESMR